MEVVTLENFNKLKPSTIPIAKFYSYLSDEIYQDAITNATHVCILLQYLLTKQIIYPFLTTIWDYMDGCAKQYCCALVIYLLSFLAL